MIQAATGLVCANAVCDWKLRAIPADRRCVVCGRPLTNHQCAVRTCEQAHCRRTHLVDRPLAANRARRLAISLQAQKIRLRAARARKIEDADSYRVTIIPKNHDKARPLAKRRRKRFEANLATVIEQTLAHERLVATGAASPPAPLPAIVPPAKALGEVLMQACIECRGFCCRTGGEHAYITQYTIMAYRRAHPQASREEIVASYASHLPSHSLPHGCVFQHAKGCTLPREMRGDTCNRHYCTALKQLTDEVRDIPSPKAFFVATGDYFFGRAVFAAPGFVQLVRNTATEIQRAVDAT